MAIDTAKMPKLGFGLMRLPEKDGAINYDEVCKMVDKYMSAGLNYFDTAYVYHGGRSEVAARECVVKRYPRDSFYLATKLPAWELKTEEDRDRIFDIQRERAGVDYFDYYLLHSIEEGGNYNTYERLNCFEWGVKKREEGKIKHFGFSFHGSPALLEKLLDDHPEVEFVQIQLNYADWDNPVIASGKLYEILHERNIPIIVMEPVKGGTLASPVPEILDLFNAERPGASAASWALRFVGSLPGVMTILSGMSNEAQMTDNISTFTDFEPISEKEKEVIEKAKEIMLGKPTIGCTSCRYCCDGCPQGIKIPDVFSLVNAVRVYGNDWRAKNFYNSHIAPVSRAGDCIACGQCEGVCPQHLPIIELLKSASEQFD
ncbi:MAG TPA: Fe-S oxidoreductase [Ruminococcaceae bacterium]|nr:Fe-S oxidoreductase [Oscillospiraceae bacterium]